MDAEHVIRRRRECLECLKRFTTYERWEELPLSVLKCDSRIEPYDRTKLREGVLKACEKRPIPIDSIEKLIAEIEYELQDYVMEVPSKVIGEKVMKKLKDLDPVAYIRFASVYLQFPDIDAFMKEAQNLKENLTKPNGKKPQPEEVVG